MSARSPTTWSPDDDSRGCGEFWTYVAIDPESKVIPAWQTSKRTVAATRAFVEDLAGRMRGRIQLSTDELTQYDKAIPRAFAGKVDYGRVVKVYGAPPARTARGGCHDEGGEGGYARGWCGGGPWWP
ncbi:hypothetical protein IIA16_02565 [bacterium]|nr:hypothetical protein [bacterium]